MSSQPQKERICVRCRRVIPPEMRWKHKRGKWNGPVCQRCLSHLYRQKGYSAERDLVRKLEKLNINAIRIPTSAPGQISLPDIIGFRNPTGPAYAFEVKAWEAFKHKRITIPAWTRGKEGKLEPGQLIKCLEYLRKMYPPSIEKHAGLAVKWILGSRTKSPWTIRFVDDPGDLTQLKDVTASIEDPSDLEVSKPSKRARYIMRVRRERRAG